MRDWFIHHPKYQKAIFSKCESDFRQQRARRQWQSVLFSSRGDVPCNKWQQRSFNHIFLACRGLIHAWVAISGGGCTELGSPGCCCLFFIACLFWLVERRSLRLLTFSPALLWICIFMNGAQEGLGELDARQTKKTTEGRRGGKAGEKKKTFKAKEIAQFRRGGSRCGRKQLPQNNRSRRVVLSWWMNEKTSSRKAINRFTPATRYWKAEIHIPLSHCCDLLTISP